MLYANLEKLSSKLDKIPDEFWVQAENGEQVIWFLDREDGTAGSYETSQERLGMTKEREIIYGFSSGCSCWGGWVKNDYCPTLSYKEFTLKKIQTFSSKDGSRYSVDEKNADITFAEGWDKESSDNLNDFLLLIEENLEPKKVLEVKNAEIRRYLIKRIGYENIKNDVQAEVLHKDGTSELLKFNNGECYVKVKDTSTDREYLLFVPNNIKTCREGIAWTFGLKENEYNPIIES